MNKKGFTLVELIITIAIIGIITIIAIPKVLDTIDKSKIKLYEEQEKRLQEATNKYLNENYISPIESVIIIQKDTLVSEGYIDEIYDLNDVDNACLGYIKISDYNTVPTIKAYISCTNYETSEFDINNIE